MTNDDQVQGTGSTESEVKEETKTEETQETQTNEQSNQTGETKVKEEENLFDLPDGRKVDAKTLSKEWKENFYPEFTRRSQTLREYERAEKERQVKAEEEARKSVSGSDIASKVPSDVREAIVQIMKPEFEKWGKEQESLKAQKEADLAFEKKLDDLEFKFQGKDGLPKFDKVGLLRAMQEPGNKNFDPESKWEQMNKPAFDDYKIKQALKQKSGSLSTESTGRESERKPESKGSPKTFEEAAKRFTSRLIGQE